MIFFFLIGFCPKIAGAKTLFTQSKSERQTNVYFIYIFLSNVVFEAISLLHSVALSILQAELVKHQRFHFIFSYFFWEKESKI